MKKLKRQKIKYQEKNEKITKMKLTYKTREMEYNKLKEENLLKRVENSNLQKRIRILENEFTSEKLKKDELEKAMQKQRADSAKEVDQVKQEMRNLRQDKLEEISMLINLKRIAESNVSIMEEKYQKLEIENANYVNVVSKNVCEISTVQNKNVALEQKVESLFKDSKTTNIIVENFRKKEKEKQLEFNQKLLALTI